LTCLADLCTIVMGQSPPSSTYNTEKRGLPFFQGKAEFSKLHPVPVKWCDACVKIAQRNDILVSVRAPVGASNIADCSCGIGRGLAAVRYDPCNSFLFYFLKCHEKDLDKKGTGTTFRAISGDVLRSYPIHLPPLPEQRAIVAKIEQLFSELDNGIANLKKAQEQLKVYRQAVLKKAFEGDLTKAWREAQVDLPSAKELLDRITTEREQAAKAHGKKLKPVKPIGEQELAELPVLPEGWAWARIDNILAEHRDCGYGVLQPGEHVPDGTPLIRVGDINDGIVSIFDMKKISPIIAGQYKRTFLKGGEVLITLVGAIGRTAVVRDSCIGSNVARAVGVIPVSSQLNSFFIELYLRRDGMVQELINKSHEVARKTLNLEDVKNTIVVVAPYQEQSQIVNEIETRISVCDNLESAIKESLEKAEALRQSILKKAFDGSLLSEAELQETRNAPDWEPAEQLLERIRAERKSIGVK